MPQKVEIIAIGDELTSGRIQNTTSGFAARQLFDAGYEIDAMNTIGDDPEMIGKALQRALSRADAIIVTGGLGSTDDDLTNEAVARALNRPAQLNPDILSAVRCHLDKITDTPVSGLEKLAWLPSGAQAFDPESKIAGYLLVHDDKPIFFLPGVPEQMRQLLIDKVLPTLSTWGDSHQLATCQRIYRVFNLPELEINRRIAELDLSPYAQIGYYPVFPEVHLSLTVRCKDNLDVKQIFASSAKGVETVLGDAIYGTNQDSLENVVGQLLFARRLTLATAESCTGGLISEKITNTPGSSNYFLGGVVSYANSIKTSLLGVAADTITRQGAVSRVVAELMAKGIRNVSGSDIGLSVTGIAGPGGGTADKPVGTVYIGIATPKECWVNRFAFSGSRKQIRLQTAYSGLDLVRKYLLRDETSSFC